MYIGSTGPKGLHHLVYEVVDNAVDEAQAGFASQVDVEVLEDGSVSVSDDGRGIPVDVHPKTGKSALETGGWRRAALWISSCRLALNTLVVLLSVLLRRSPDCPPRWWQVWWRELGLQHQRWAARRGRQRVQCAVRVPRSDGVARGQGVSAGV